MVYGSASKALLAGLDIVQAWNLISLRAVRSLVVCVCVRARFKLKQERCHCVEETAVRTLLLEVHRSWRQRRIKTNLKDILEMRRKKEALGGDRVARSTGTCDNWLFPYSFAMAFSYNVGT